MTNSIVRRPGDTGQTRLGSGLVVDKDSPAIEMLGVLDELDASIGVVQSVSSSSRICEILIQIRGVIRKLDEQIAADSRLILSSKEVEDVERLIEAFRKVADTTRDGPSSGIAYAAACADVASTQCRRAERRLFTLSEVPFAASSFSDYPIERRQYRYALQYLNRLSDLLALIAADESLVAEPSNGQIANR